MKTSCHPRGIATAVLLLAGSLPAQVQETFSDDEARAVQSFLSERFSGENGGMLIGLLDSDGAKASVSECFGLMGGPIGTKVRLELTGPENDGMKRVELTRQKFLTSGG